VQKENSMYESQWDIGTALSVGWERFKEHAVGVLLCMVVVGGIQVVVGVVSWVGQQIPMLLGNADIDEVIIVALSLLVQLFFNIISWLVRIWFALGLFQVFLKAARGQEPEIGDLFRVGDLYLLGLLVSLATAVAWLGGFLTFFLLWIPWIIMGLGFYFRYYVLVDQQVGVLDAFKESWRLTDGEKWMLLLWHIVIGLINLVGFLCCVVGLLITGPVTAIGTAYIYDNLVKTKGRMDGSEHAHGGAAGGSSGGHDFEASAESATPASRSTTDGDAPLMSKG
jgi:hypothetical protein